MENYLSVFNNYYSNYNKNDLHISGKYDHTFRVIEYASIIAKSLNLSDGDIELVKSCALFHDIGRFYQHEKYGTFNDKESIDHGDVGASILEELEINSKIIISTVKYHNKYEIPHNLTEKEKLFCKIIRDADKIDIMDKNIRECENDEFIINDQIIDAITNHKQLIITSDIPYNNSVYVNLRLCAFIFDINYYKSLEIIKEKNIINIACDNILKKYNYDVIKKFKNIFNSYLEERINEYARIRKKIQSY